MSSIAQASYAMEHILKGVAKAIERETGFVQRSTAQLDGPGFAQMAVWTWADTPDASYSQLQHVAASLGTMVSVQAIEQRLLHEAVGEVLCSDARVPELLSRFTGVYVQDGTVISSPESLKQQWRGCGGSTADAGPSSLRIQVRVDLARGGMQGPWLQEGRASERSGEAHETPLPAGSLYDVDGGYFTLGEMRARGEAGEFWLSTPTASTQLYDQRGQCWSLASFLQQQQAQQVDAQVSLGKRERLPVRLLATRVAPSQAQRRRQQATSTVEGKRKGIVRPNERARTQGAKRLRQRKRNKTGPARMKVLEWTILITNVPKARLSRDEAVVLARCRWQIELCWKLWKQIGKVDTWRSAKPERILTEIFAKVLGLLLSHWLTVLGCWQTPNRSVVKAHQVVQWMAPALALGVAGVVSLDLMVQRTTQTMACGCTIHSRRQKPNTYQLVAQPNLIHSSVDAHWVPFTGTLGRGFGVWLTSPTKTPANYSLLGQLRRAPSVRRRRLRSEPP